MNLWRRFGFVRVNPFPGHHPGLAFSIQVCKQESVNLRKAVIHNRFCQNHYFRGAGSLFQPIEAPAGPIPQMMSVNPSPSTS